MVLLALLVSACNMHNAGTAPRTINDGTWTAAYAPNGAPYAGTAQATPVAATQARAPASVQAAVGAPADLSICQATPASPAAQEAGLARTGTYNAPIVNVFAGSRYVTFVRRDDRFRGAFVNSNMVNPALNGCTVTSRDQRWTVTTDGRVRVEQR